MTILHVTNGESATGRLADAGFAGAMLPWNDVLHDGPVPDGSDDALREVRARFLAERGWTSLEEARLQLAKRDATLLAALADPSAEVVLWFEHDLYDQLQLVQVLDLAARAGEQGAPPRARLRAVHADDYLGHATPERLQAWHALAHDVTPAELDVARTAWAAIRAPDPRQLDALAGSTRAAPLPFLRAALRRLVEELPDVRTGLARSERAALQAIADGARTAADAFAAVAATEPAIYLGDASFAWYLERLGGCREPLLAGADGRPPGRLHASGLRLWRPRLTAAGERVLAGEADHVRLNGIARWLGGVLLDGLSPWRCAAGRVTKVAVS